MQNEYKKYNRLMSDIRQRPLSNQKKTADCSSKAKCFFTKECSVTFQKAHILPISYFFWNIQGLQLTCSASHLTRKIYTGSSVSLRCRNSHSTLCVVHTLIRSCSSRTNPTIMSVLPERTCLAPSLQRLCGG